MSFKLFTTHMNCKTIFILRLPVANFKSLFRGSLFKEIKGYQNLNLFRYGNTIPLLIPNCSFLLYPMPDPEKLNELGRGR